MTDKAELFDDDELLDPEAAAKLLGLGYKALEARRARGQEPPFIKLGSARNASIRYRRRDLEDWLERNRHTPTAKQPQLIPEAAVLEALQAVIARCVMEQMRHPFEMRIEDSRGQRGGSLIHWEGVEPLPDGTPTGWKHGYPPLKVEITDADGERREFDVDFARAGDGRLVPDARLH